MQLSKTQKTAMVQLAQDYMGMERTITSTIRMTTIASLIMRGVVDADYDSESHSYSNVKLYKKGIEWASINVTGFAEYLKEQDAPKVKAQYKAINEELETITFLWSTASNNLGNDHNVTKSLAIAMAQAERKQGEIMRLMMDNEPINPPMWASRDIR